MLAVKVFCGAAREELRNVSRQDRDLAVVALITGTALLASLTGTGWALLHLARLVTTGRKTA